MPSLAISDASRQGLCSKYEGMRTMQANLSRQEKIDRLKEMIASLKKLGDEWRKEETEKGRNPDDSAPLRVEKMTADILGGWLETQMELQTAEKELQRLKRERRRKPAS